MCEHGWARPALDPKQWTQFIVPSFAVITQIWIKVSLIRCERRTSANTTNLFAMIT